MATDEPSEPSQHAVELVHIFQRIPDHRANMADKGSLHSQFKNYLDGLIDTRARTKNAGRTGVEELG